jgi:capsular exopolysaccharide synthesis family protein
MLIGAVVGLGVGGGIIFLLDMLDPTMRIYEDLEKLFEDQDLPLLGLIPGAAVNKGQPVLMTDANHPFSDIYERVRSNLQIAAVQSEEGKVPKIVLITSAAHQEGKTTTAYNLAIASARSGRRTLILELDFRTPSQAWRLGVQPDDQAVIEPLRYYGRRLSDPIQMVPSVENLYISPGVGPQRNPAAVADSSEMERLLKEARARFDFIVVDASNLTASNDAILLEAKTDGMILVGRPNYTKKPLLASTLEQLEENEEIRLLGAVINGAKIPVAEAQQRDDSLLSEPDDAEEPKSSAAPTRKVPVATPVDF